MRGGNRENQEIIGGIPMSIKTKTLFVQTFRNAFVAFLFVSKIFRIKSIVVVGGMKLRIEI